MKIRLRKRLSALRKRLRLKKKATKLSLMLNYILGNYRSIIWLIGSARSGTTWVSDLINHDDSYREMFEPFHPILIPEMRFLAPHQYVKPNVPNPQLQKAVSSVFSGRFLQPRSDAYNSPKIYKGILVKDIFANLFARWVSIRYPHVKIILLIRNPFAVALSIYKKRDWDWVTDPITLLNDRDLYEDYLKPFDDLIRNVSKTDDQISKQILIWSIINYVPLKQFEQQNIHICFYEDIFKSPEYEIAEIYKYISGDLNKSIVPISSEIIKRPSRVVGSDSNILNKTSPITSWKNELTPIQIENGMKILRHFGFDDLYMENGMPNKDSLRKFSNHGISLPDID